MIYFQLDQVYDPNSPEDDMNERYEEMNRMREHVMNELDKDKDKLVSQNEFMKYTASQDFDKDEPWEVRGSHTHTHTRKNLLRQQEMVTFSQIHS